MRTKFASRKPPSMRTTLELPDLLFARLKAPPANLPRLAGPLAIEVEQLSNAALFELLDT
jgi:hypothetical protein